MGAWSKNRCSSGAAFDYFREAAAKSGRMDAAILNDTDKAIVDNLKLREGKHLRNAGVLLFHKNPERFIPGAYIKIGFFRSESDLAYQDEVYGNLFVQAQKTLDLLMTKYMKAYISYEGVQRIDRFLFPRDAIREVLHNALVHRDYSTGIPIQIRVYEDHVRFYNNGHLPDGWTITDLLKEHMSEPFNPLIANAFFRTGDIEAWGRGIDTIRDACRKNSTDFPTFEFMPTSVMVEFKGKVPKTATERATPKTTPKTTPIAPQKMRDRILDILRDQPNASRSDIANALTDISAEGVRYHLRKLAAAGRIRHAGPARGGRWEVLDD
jgi:ATP-dependent DNA helicase RecG